MTGLFTGIIPIRVALNPIKPRTAYQPALRQLKKSISDIIRLSIYPHPLNSN
jgi:hypothetical protein